MRTGAEAVEAAVKQGQLQQSRHSAVAAAAGAEEPWRYVLLNLDAGLDRAERVE